MEANILNPDMANFSSKGKHLRSGNAAASEAVTQLHLCSHKGYTNHWLAFVPAELSEKQEAAFGF